MSPTRDYYDNVPDDPFSRCLEDYQMTLTVIAEKFATEAVRRGWCGEFEDFVNSVNEILPHPLVTHPPTPVEVTIVLKYNAVIHGERAGASDDQLESRFLDQVESGFNLRYFRENLGFEFGPATQAVSTFSDIKVVRRET